MLSPHSTREGRDLIIFAIMGIHESLLSPLSQKLLGFMQRPVIFFSTAGVAVVEALDPDDESVVGATVVAKTGVTISPSLVNMLYLFFISWSRGSCFNIKPC